MAIDTTDAPAPDTTAVAPAAPAAPAAPSTTAAPPPLPTADDAFGATTPPQPGQAPTAEEAFGPQSGGDFAREQLNKTKKDVSYLGTAIDTFVSTLPQTAAMEAAKVINENPHLSLAQGIYNTVKPVVEDNFINPKPIDYSDLYKPGDKMTPGTVLDIVNRSILQGPVGSGFTLVNAPVMAALAPLFNTGAEAIPKGSGAARVLDTVMAATTILGIAHAGGIKGEMSKGVENQVIGSPESVTMGLEEPTPQMADTASRMAAENNPPPAPTVPEPPDIHTVARNLHPELFDETDRLDARQEVLRDTLRNSDQVFGKDVDDKIAALEKEQEPLTRAPVDLEGEGLHQVITENQAKAGELDTQIRELKAGREEYIKQATAEAQKEYIDNFHRRAELGPEVNKAYNAAQEYTPPPEEEKQVVPAEAPKETIAEESAEKGPPAVPKALDTRITQDFSKRLQDVGRPKEEADVQAALVAAHYQAVVDQGWAKGDPFDIYQKHVPVIAEGAAKETKKLLSLSQRKPLMQSAAELRNDEAKTEAFKKWFGKSKVVDKNGNPQVVHHGTSKEFDSFDTKGGWSPGSWFAVDKGKVKDFGSKEYHVYLNIETPGTALDLARARQKVAADGIDGMKDRRDFNEAVIKEMQTQGFDGIHAENFKGAGGKEVWVAFHPEQIKSVHNEGTFDPNDPRILHQGAARGSYVRAFGDYLGGIIGLRPSADATTLIHEIAHAWLDEMTAFSKEPDAPQNLTDRVRDLRQQLGADDPNADWTRSQHERFARGFERYVRDGVAPSKALEQAFIKLREWFTQIYSKVKQLNVSLPEEMKVIYDHLLEAKPDRVKPEAAKKTVIAKERTPGKSIADIHEADAETTPPAQADKVGDNVEKEIDATVKLHDPEIADVLKAAETTGITEPAQGAAAAPTAGQSPGESGAPAEPGAVAGSGSEAAAGSSGLREQQPAVTTGAEPIPASGDASRATPTEGTRGIAPIGTDEPNAGGSGSRLVDKAGNIRLENLTSDADVRNAIRERAKQGGYDNASTKKVTQREMSDLAFAAGIEQKDISLKKLQAMAVEDGVPMAVHVQIVRQAFIDSEKELKRLDDIAANGTDEDVANYANAVQRHLLIGKTLSAATAEAGRTLGSGFVNISKADLKNAQELSEFLQSATGKTLEDYRKMAQQSARLKEKGQASKFVQDSVKPDFIDKIQEYRDIALLSGPVTHLTYVNANIINLAIRPLERYAARKIGEITDAEDKVQKGEATAMAYALLDPSTFKNALESWRTYQQVLPGVEGKFTTLGPQIGDKTGVMRTAMAQVPRAINALHSFNYTAAWNQNMAALSVRMAMKEGLDPASDEFAKRLTDIRQNPPDDMRKAASEDALKEVNQGKSGSSAGKLSLWINSNRALKWFFPFIKMEAAAKTNAYFERTPLGYLSKDIRANLSGANGTVARDIQRGKMAANMAVAGAMFTLGSQFVSDNGPDDPDKHREWLLTHVPNSIQIGDTAFALKNLGRMGEYLKFGATIHRTMGEWFDGVEGDKVAGDVTNNVMHDLTDGTFTENMKNLTDVLYNPRQYGTGFIQNFATQFLPFSVGMSQVAHLTDPFYRDTKAEGESGFLGGSMKIANAAASKTPFLSYELEAKYDMFGQPISRHASYQSQYRDDPTVQRMDALHMGVGVLNSKIAGVQLDDHQYAAYSQQAGIQVKDTLDKLIASSGFDQQPTVVQIKAIHDAIRWSREITKQSMLHEYPDLLSKANDFQRLTHGGSVDAE